jgi:hypothetical protein
MRVTAMDTVAPLPDDHDVPEAMRFTWGPALQGDTIAYRVFNPKGHFDYGTVYDHIHVVGVGLEDGIEFTSEEETQAVEDELWAGSSYDGQIGLPTDLPDGIYACSITADCLRSLEPRPVGYVGFRVEQGAIQPV